LTMGEFSKRLHRKLKAASSGSPSPASYKNRKPLPGAPDVAKLIAEGMDPVHAAYVFIHYIASSFASNASHVPEMRAFTEDYVNAEQQYLPSGPPMSPLTKSYFSCWAFYDLRIGKSRALIDTAPAQAFCASNTRSTHVVSMCPEMKSASRKIRR
jgi:hypothetical protein